MSGSDFGGSGDARHVGRGFRGYRRVYHNGFGRDRDRQRNGLGPNFSRFDDDLTPPQKLDMTPVDGISTTNVYWEWCEKQKAARKPEEPFKFEPPETDFHLQATAFWKEMQEERKQGAVMDLRGNLMLDCLGAHGPGQMCQFCDGQRGKWFSKPSKPADPAFRRYQDSIIAGGAAWSSARARPSNNQPNTLKLAPLDDLEEIAAQFEKDTSALTTDN